MQHLYLCKKQTTVSPVRALVGRRQKDRDSATGHAFCFGLHTCDHHCYAWVRHCNKKFRNVGG